MVQRVLGAVAAAAIDGCLQALLELAPVEQAGERVVRGLMGDFTPEGAYLGDVAEYQHRAENPAGRTANRRGRELDGVFATAATGEQEVGGAADNLATGERARHRVVHRRARGVVDDGKDFHQPPAVGVVRGPAGQPFGDRVQVLHAPGAVGADDAIAHGVQRGERAFLFLMQRGIGMLRAPQHDHGDAEAESERGQRKQDQQRPCVPIGGACLFHGQVGGAFLKVVEPGELLEHGVLGRDGLLDQQPVRLADLTLAGELDDALLNRLGDAGQLSLLVEQCALLVTERHCP
ncbi:MAG: hypothetical protein A2150_01870 [Candidatus Muproteobacteria bacterium RBG_16_64_11]|uniref:Uncharacterized protein n=1 Tax=Candidatus Muproteobacteria bacterium RBG_16_64_11 TaxID=1817758 RepID=A0A1F6T9J2_9PROT|nr:MAG: hypothetical protein A2150_01870 [Candidatus Muproteobacteria bacterium RBG_16_64_11]